MLHERSRAVFCLEDVRDITGLSESSARSFVRKLVDRGWRFASGGLYVLVPFELGRNGISGQPLSSPEIMHGRSTTSPRHGHGDPRHD
jgi:predicted transcriptional regulator of viral defense system